METTNLRKFLGGAMMSSQSNGEEENRREKIVFQELTTKIERSLPDHHESGSSSSAKKGHLDDQLESAKAEIDEVMEENQRLKMYFDRILKDYRTLEMQYRDFIQQEAVGKSPNSHDQKEETAFVALSLGRTSSGTIKVEPHKSPIIENNIDKESLTLGLDCKMTKVEVSPNPSSENSIEEVIKEEAEQTSPPNKMKNVRDGAEDDILLQNPTKRARVAVRVRCDTPSMNDGCQWRKYGQKISKGNPCPRAYYRCTVAPSCPVRKQVQRCVEDMSILITTYEGTHNHPLPISATAMASTTSAAASMLLSGSSTSGSGPNSSSIPANLNGLNYYLSDNARPKSSIYLSNSLILSTPSFPTITLDLTSTQPSSSNLTRPANFPPRYSTTNLNFNSLESNPLPNTWSNSMLTSYNTSHHQQYNRNFQNTSNSLNFGDPQSHETLYQSYLNQNNQQYLAPDSIAAASKAIASDPSFQSALVAALSSIIGSGGTSTSVTKNQHVGENLISQNIKSSEPFRILSSFPSIADNENKRVPSFMNKSSSSATGTQQGI